MGIANDFKGDARIKVVTVMTIFNKNIRLFLRVSNEKEREQFRMFRDSQLDNHDIEFFKKQGKNFYNFVAIHNTPHRR